MALLLKLKKNVSSVEYLGKMSLRLWNSRNKLKRKRDLLDGMKYNYESTEGIEQQPRRKLRKVSPNRSRDVGISNLENSQTVVEKVMFYAKVSGLITKVDGLIQWGNSLKSLFIDDPPPIGQVLVPTTLFGEHARNVMEQIWAHLMGDAVSNIGVWGMAGVGKSATMRNINSQLLDETDKFNIVIWITVSTEMNYIAKIQDDIARALKKESDLLRENDKTKRAGKVYEMLTEIGKYVLIFDDVWNTFSLQEEVGIPEASEGSKIVIISQRLEVCRYFDAQVVRLHKLSRPDARDFFNQTLGRRRRPPPSIVESLLNKCDGLPSAIVSIARSMKGKPESYEWSNADEEFSKSAESEKIFQRLQVGYDRLEDENVKHCFLYLASYPDARAVRKVTLIRRWINEGLFEEMDSMQAKLDKGHTIMNKLINNCLFEETRNGNAVKLDYLTRGMALRNLSA